MAFPFVLRESEAAPEDIERLAPLLVEVARKRIICREAQCLPVGQREALAQLPEAWQAAAATLATTGEPQRLKDAEGTHLLLPIGVGKRPAALMLLAAVAEEHQWSAAALAEAARSLTAASSALKEKYTDPLTGLANTLLLHRHLRRLVAEPVRGVVVALLELYPPSRDAERAWAYVQKGANYLISLFGAAASLFHLGGGVFALLWESSELAEAQRTAALLLSRLRREDFTKAHIGLRPLTRGLSAEEVLDEAWAALAVARTRGPFGLCVHGQEQVAAVFQPLTRNEQRKVAGWWRGKDRFALVLIRQDQPAVSNHFVKRLREALDDAPSLLLNQREALVFLEDADRERALGWVKRFRRRMRKSAGGSFSLGIALYPCLSFSKAQVPVNCRKALQHAEFFGPDSEALFDGVSCNVSGDVYYNGGDIPRAVREYRLGLAMDPGNVNLLNSLGVAHVQLKQPRKAQNCFETALRHDHHNFMALFNLGFLQLHQGGNAKALDYFERALATNDHHFDLLLQLGRLYCQQKRFAEAAKLLHRCVGAGKIDERRNADLAAAWRLLGEAHAGLKENRKAIRALQKVLSLNSRDAQALSMLGELYAREKQGNDIALSLCQEAVLLDGAEGEHWRRLAWVQWARGDADGAVASLKQCLHFDRRNSAALFWLARIYREQGRVKEAQRLYEKVLRLQPNHAEARSALAQVNQ